MIYTSVAQNKPKIYSTSPYRTLITILQLSFTPNAFYVDNRTVFVFSCFSLFVFVLNHNEIFHAASVCAYKITFKISFKIVWRFFRITLQRDDLYFQLECLIFTKSSSWRFAFNQWKNSKKKNLNIFFDTTLPFQNKLGLFIHIRDYLSRSINRSSSAVVNDIRFVFTWNYWSNRKSRAEKINARLTVKTTRCQSSGR